MHVPCGAVARLCLAHHLNVDDHDAIGERVLMLDGQEVEGKRRMLDVGGRHLCVESVGCGASGVARTVSLVSKA